MTIDNFPDFMTDVYDWLAFVTAIDGNRIIRGNQSREVLPDDNDYIVYTPITQKRIGTNIAVLHAEGVPDNENAPDTDTKLLQIDLQIDCYGDNAFMYSQGIETFARAGRCNEWLKQNEASIRVLYASDPIDGTLVDDTHQFVTRWITTLSICIPVSDTDKIPWIEDAQVVPNPATPSNPPGVKLKNIDIVYKE
jgi:hypothetical protein